MIVGLGAANSVNQLEVRWPSGVRTQLEHIPVGSLVTAYEDARHGDGGSFDVQPYLPASDRGTSIDDPRRTASPSLTISSDRAVPTESPSQAKLNVYVTMATWCTACLEHAPHLHRIRSEFADDELELVGLPIDPEEGPDQLIRYYERVQPPYHRLMLELTPSERAAIQSVLDTINPPDAVPATIVTDAQGQVRYAAPGTPTLSQLRKLLAPN
jgi:thiol-disulfide isomerase/thioredoxin